jgi:hypothetical protein
MFLSTKSVRRLANTINVQTRSRTYTDKTLEDKASTRRSVVFCFWDGAEADKLYAGLKELFAQGGFKNTIKRTGTDSSYANRTSGGEYVRVIAHMTE